MTKIIWYILWVDALGTEYVPLMKYLAGINGLASRITVTRANIPTITKMNRGFYDAWPESLRQKESPVCILEYQPDIVKSYGKPATLRSEFEDAFNS